MQGSRPPISAELMYMREGLQYLSYDLAEFYHTRDPAKVQDVMKVMIEHEKVLTRIAEELLKLGL